MQSWGVVQRTTELENWPTAATSLEHALGNLRSALDHAQQELHKARADYESLRLLACSLPVDLVNPSQAAPLSAQERRVARLAAMGRSDLEAAATLHLSVHTVKSHMKNVLRKLDLHSRWQLQQAHPASLAE
jgi:DNA-binding CsgD family transcriptional regulator